MRAAGKAPKTEKCLLGLTAVFLCLLAGLSLYDARRPEPVRIRREPSASQAGLVPGPASRQKTACSL